jgi:hypothetical protein
MLLISCSGNLMGLLNVQKKLIGLSKITDNPI